MIKISTVTLIPTTEQFCKLWWKYKSLTFANVLYYLLILISFLAIIVSTGGRMFNVEQDWLDEDGDLLLEVKCAKSQTLFAKLNICFLINSKYRIDLFFLQTKINN